MRRLLLLSSLAIGLVIPITPVVCFAQANASQSNDGFNLSSVDALLAKGDREAASGNLTDQ
ncbi:MAG: hypothetical protein EBU13_10935 [Synechococcaceae bacterium WB5_2A_257]|nr:hypothetical protein [Synechococcaceae bacterium WB5_2A_257]